MIKAKNVTKKFGSNLVVKDVSFFVGEGEIFGLLGPNGAGKSTLLGMMATVIPPTSGDILINNNSVISNKEKVRQLISYVPQQLSLHMQLTVEDNLKFWSNMVSANFSSNHLKDIAGIVGLQNNLQKKVEHLSEGMKRRLNIGVSLIHDPQIMIMDEPTLGVDIKSKKEIVDFISTLSDWGKTIVYTSHDIREISQLCHRISLLNEGEIMFIGTLEEASSKAYNDGFNGSHLGEHEELEEMLSKLGKW